MIALSMPMKLRREKYYAVERLRLSGHSLEQIALALRLPIMEVKECNGMYYKPESECRRWLASERLTPPEMLWIDLAPHHTGIFLTGLALVVARIAWGWLCGD